VVLQDVTALDILEKVIQTEPEGYQELSINIDSGGLAARRILKRMANA
jgi:vanillate O-demethylase monooxygenase subunit